MISNVRAQQLVEMVWGNSGRTQISDGVCSVGYMTMFGVNVLGSGASWEEAFADLVVNLPTVKLPPVLDCPVWAAERIDVKYKGIDYGVVSWEFTCNVMRDGIYHHTYAESGISDPASVPVYVKKHIMQLSTIADYNPGGIPDKIDTQTQLPPTAASDLVTVNTTIRELIACLRDLQQWSIDYAIWQQTANAAKVGYTTQENADTLFKDFTANYKTAYKKYLK